MYVGNGKILGPNFGNATPKGVKKSTAQIAAKIDNPETLRPAAKESYVPSQKTTPEVPPAVDSATAEKLETVPEKKQLATPRAGSDMAIMLENIEAAKTGGNIL